MPDQLVEESKQFSGLLRVQVIEESKSDAFITAKVDEPAQKRERMADDLRRANKKKNLSKRRQTMATNQAILEEVENFEQEYYYPDQVDEYGYEEFPLQPIQTAE